MYLCSVTQTEVWHLSDTLDLGNCHFDVLVGVTAFTNLILEFKEGRRERERELYKTIDLATEYNHFMWECNHLATFLPSSLETERENLNSGVL